MCGRYSICKSPKELEALFDVHSEGDIAGPVYNAAPTMLLPAISMQKPNALQFFHWGITRAMNYFSTSDTLLINARAESVFEKKTFKEWIFHSRCVIPADGFYEWTKNGKIRQPWRFCLSDNSVFALAGIYTTIQDDFGKAKSLFSIITTRANEKVSPYHDRMPVILNSTQVGIWLTANSRESLEDIMVPLSSDAMQVYAVSTKINKPGVNTSDLIKPLQSSELTLF